MWDPFAFSLGNVGQVHSPSSERPSHHRVSHFFFINLLKLIACVSHQHRSSGYDQARPFSRITTGLLVLFSQHCWVLTWPKVTGHCAAISESLFSVGNRNLQAPSSYPSPLARPGPSVLDWHFKNTLSVRKARSDHQTDTAYLCPPQISSLSASSWLDFFFFFFKGTSARHRMVSFVQRSLLGTSPRSPFTCIIH